MTCTDSNLGLKALLSSIGYPKYGQECASVLPLFFPPPNSEPSMRRVCGWTIEQLSQEVLAITNGSTWSPPFAPNSTVGEACSRTCAEAG
eukprot:1337735-Prymnesium_polylepis.1